MRAFPGDYLGCSEEFLAGEGVYEEDGKIYAAVAGKVVVKDRKISIKPEKEIPKIEKGDEVIGKVVDVKKKFALVELLKKVNMNRSPPYYDLALLPASEISEKFVEDVSEFLSHEDIILGRVIDENLRISIKGKNYGVISTKCSCGGELILEEDKLKCSKCGKTNRKKISSYYGGAFEWR
ncbi:exosome complex RNA-binding protein Csl4 [Ferroglobus placidus DSM 10642]|uniref:Exosome complex component Csl4 n=1 Tax=Ferroglobus placidus (strain DSM 10642 / AEDII12DO) TaxID=589924 RepID=D3S1Z4_FERPA|nr:exosome complex RNA-binding protein Csl4 [Ferroglobus placidus]ADC64451.1 exosome complex RNA-binding protein Csl4 [Ferroglobus placidus DSM 10642]